MTEQALPAPARPSLESADAWADAIVDRVAADPRLGDPRDVAAFWEGPGWDLMQRYAALKDPYAPPHKVWFAFAAAMGIPGEPRSSDSPEGRVRVCTLWGADRVTAWVGAGGSTTDALIALAAALCPDPPEDVLAHAAGCLLAGRVAVRGRTLR